MQQTQRILLVDDEPDHCLTYQIILLGAGYECISYSDSVKALQEFKPDYYDLVILDIRMPKLDGFGLFDKIREIDKAVKIIFITAGENFQNQYCPKLSDDVNTTCIQKPIGNQELIQIINSTTSKKSLV